MPIRGPRVFTIPPGVPFPPTLAEALLAGKLIEGFPGAGQPLALAGATIYVPTQRAAAALGRALFEASKQSAILLPRIAPLGVLEPGEDQAFASEAGAPPREALVAAVKPLARRHVLARFVRKWGEALRGAIRAADANGLVFDPAAPALVATTPAEAYALANDLAALIDDLIIEGVDPAAIEAIEVGAAHDEYWRITLDFLKIAFANWPLWLAEQGLVDRAQRGQGARSRAEIAALQRPDATRGPTIVAGSTGANARRRKADRGGRAGRARRGRSARPRPGSRRPRLGDDRGGRGRRRIAGPCSGPPASADPAHRREPQGGDRPLGAPTGCASRARGAGQRGAAAGRFDRLCGASARRRSRRPPSPRRSRTWR